MTELRLCSWCGTPCSGRDEAGDPACPTHASEQAAEHASLERVARVRETEPAPPVDFARQVHAFVIGEFRSFGACV